MSCSLAATYKYTYNNGEIVKYGKGTCVLGSDTGVAPVMQETTMYQLLVAAFAGTGVTLDTNHNYTQENLILDSNAVSVSGLDIVVDGIIVVEYIGIYPTYPKYTTVQIDGVTTGSYAINVKNAITQAITNSISNRWIDVDPSITIVNDFVIKSINLYAHL